jgi:hypothetical protein
MPEHIRRRSWLAACASLAFCAAFVGCWHFWWFPTWTIHVILPTGYRGEVRFILDPESGIDVPWRWGTYTYRIPDNGGMRVRDFSPFQQWHNESWTYPDGTAIPEAWHVDNLPLGDPRRNVGPVLVHAGGSDGYRIAFFIGSFREYHEWLESD